MPAARTVDSPCRIDERIDLLLDVEDRSFIILPQVRLVIYILFVQGHLFSGLLKGERNATRHGECGRPARHKLESEKAPPAKSRQRRSSTRLPLQGHLFSGRLKAELTVTHHGGDERSGRRKIERPVSTRLPMHVTLHSDQARGRWSLRRHQAVVSEALRHCVKRNGIKIYDFANVGSHVHLLLRARRREDFQAFLRTFAGIVARKVTGARKGKPLEGGHFWSQLAWSRIVAWGRDYLGARHYIERNSIEGSLGSSTRRALERGSRKARAASHEAKRQQGPPPGGSSRAV
jgi:REP element-mobilizing transposase RayT